MAAEKRMSREEYFMNIAIAVRKRADCCGNKVGAVIVLDDRIVSTGYNGTPSGMKNCSEGGCHRCGNREEYASGTGYDLCICVHAEQNALLAGARFGIQVAEGTMYTTMRPCFGCTKELLQARINKVYYLHDWVYPDKERQGEYEKIQARFPGGVVPMAIEDPEAEWAISNLRTNKTTA